MSRPIRLVTAAALFDGHDAAINIMRRILQSKGAEVIHLGHNRSVREIVECAIEEDVQGIAITSYQGGHLEFFKYMKDLLEENGSSHIKIFGGGGGTILPAEMDELHQYGISRIYSPDDGRKMGLEGMIDDLLERAALTPLPPEGGFPGLLGAGPFALGKDRDIRQIARAITFAENDTDFFGLPVPAASATGRCTVLGITGTGGAGKSSVTDEIVRRLLNRSPERTIAVISVDPSKKKTGGALLGDRIRMNAISSPRAYMRSLATRESDKALSKYVQQAIDICKAAAFDLIILESAGVGQSDASILSHVDISLYVMTPEYGAASQLEKINMLDYADLICINKYDKAGALDALHDVRKQYKRNHGLWSAPDEALPVVGTIAAQFNDAGVNELFDRLMEKIAEKTGLSASRPVQQTTLAKDSAGPLAIIPAKRLRYLAEIAEEIETYNQQANDQAAIARKLYQLTGALQLLTQKNEPRDGTGPAVAELNQLRATLEKQLLPVSKKLLEEWETTKARYQKAFFEYEVRGQIIRQPLYTPSLSHTPIPKIAVPRFADWGDILRWRMQENFPGKFPYTAGVFPLKRAEEDPTRMFAGEGDRKEPIAVFTMSAWDNLPKDYLRLLTVLLFTVKIPQPGRIFMAKWAIVG